jgi:hypothetical protein
MDKTFFVSDDFVSPDDALAGEGRLVEFRECYEDDEPADFDWLFDTA